MSAMLDSEAAFAARLKELNLDDLAETFRDNGWGTAAGFAFSSSYMPGAASEAPFDAVVEALVGDARSRRRAGERLACAAQAAHAPRWDRALGPFGSFGSFGPSV